VFQPQSSPPGCVLGVNAPGGVCLAERERQRAERRAVHPRARDDVSAVVDDRRRERDPAGGRFRAHAREQRERDVE
jgi:hypothetical protein